MGLYKVIALNVSGLNNKIYYLNQEVKDESFAKGHADKLVEQGFLERLETKQAEPKEVKPKTTRKRTKK